MGEDINRATVYLHYFDKFDLLDKIIEEHISNMANLCELEAEMDWIEATVLCMEYLESNYLFFSTMLASEGAPYFRSRFVQHNIEEFKKDVDITKGKNFGQSEEVVVEFVANAYVGCSGMVAKKWHALSTAGNGRKSGGFIREDYIDISQGRLIEQGSF